MHIVSRQPNRDHRPRMEPLAVLPVFFDLNGKRVLVAGGEEPAAWKAELLAAAGADVTVYASETCEEMSALAARGAVRLTGGHWRDADWEGLALAVGDCAEEEAAEFAAVARAHAVPVNVIDKPVHCQFQFGSIVNRSPLVVGISTNGAAPILGQAVRRRIEALLPRSLAAWARKARDIRAGIIERLKPGAERRAFWERFADLSFSDGTPPEGLEGMAPESSGRTEGKVTLVGASPGDAEYLTLKAVRAMQSADVILFDDLVSTEVLELARREAKRILVGKRRGPESCRQEDHAETMVSLARGGKHIVMLEAGDPMSAAQAGPTIAWLRAEGVAVTVVPGVGAPGLQTAEFGPAPLPDRAIRA